MNTESLDIHLSYRRLTAKDLASLLNDLSELSDKIAQQYYGHIIEDMDMTPSLEISTICTDHSVTISLIEGLRQIVSDSDFFIEKLYQIPLLVVYFLFCGAKKCQEFYSDHLDIQIKKIEIQLKTMELNKVIDDNKNSSYNNVPDIKSKVSSTLDFIYGNADLDIVKINDVKIKSKK